MDVWVLYNGDYGTVFGVYASQEKAEQEAIDRHNSNLIEEYQVESYEELRDDDSYFVVYGPIELTE